ncbi:hypothetical protein [Nonomuraea zeae]|uniref:Uncharacterized protein n=1 Tax=Nonomuraea zeae TaxID=1642303 RepID=A0A5S4H2Z8_9ACTN|nr:hypothetical protein [Nonomuraea zeae]TMR39633.1 hypothetical protein ETD85_01065 [Nonomuraea zeae]
MSRRVTRYAKLRRGPFETLAAEHGLTSQSAQAREIGVITSEHHRALNGQQQEISGFYVIGVLHAVGTPDVKKLLSHLFDTGHERESVAS